MVKFFTIGHSNHTFESFTDALAAANVNLVIDVRRHPGSAAMPQFDQENMSSMLPAYGIGYEHWPKLGGRRNKQPNREHGTNAAWRNSSFRNYADYALMPVFQGTLEALIAHCRVEPSHPVLMCAEAVWWRCHRRIITDHLLARKIEGNRPVFPPLW